MLRRNEYFFNEQVQKQSGALDDKINDDGSRQKPKIFYCKILGCDKCYDIHNKLVTHQRTHVKFLIIPKRQERSHFNALSRNVLSHLTKKEI